MHCEYETYVLQNRMLNLQFTGFGRPREHKLGGDILSDMDSSPYASVCRGRIYVLLVAERLGSVALVRPGQHISA